MTTTSDIATRSDDLAASVGAPVGALALRADQTEWTTVQEAALVQLGLAEASDADRMVFLHQCQRTGLDPFARQIYMIGRKDDTVPGGKKWTIQTGIDGFRAKAEEHPQYAGQLPLQWCGDDGVWVDVWLNRTKKPTAARARVLRHDREHPIQATCLFEEFAQKKTGGGYTQMWDTKGAWMNGKCAEAGALRAAFPQTFSGLITDDEAHGLTRQANATRVPSSREPSGPVDVGELTGQRPTAAAPAPQSAPSTAPRPAAALPGGTGKATAPHTKRLMAATRRTDAPENAREWAENVLQRDIRSWGVLTCDQANLLIEKLEAGPPAGGWHVAEVVEPAADTEPAAAPPATDGSDPDDEAEAYAAMEADRDAARGDA